MARRGHGIGASRRRHRSLCRLRNFQRWRSGRLHQGLWFARRAPDTCICCSAVRVSVGQRALFLEPSCPQYAWAEAADGAQAASRCRPDETCSCWRLCSILRRRSDMSRHPVQVWPLHFFADIRCCALSRVPGGIGRQLQMKTFRVKMMGFPNSLYHRKK